MWLKELKLVKKGSKWAKNTCLSIPNGVGSISVKRVFDPVLTHIWPRNGPWSMPFGLFHGPKRVIWGSKWAKNTCLNSGNGPGSLLDKCIFDPFSTHFGFQNGPFSKQFGIFRGPQCATTGSKRPKNTCLSIRNGLGTTLKKIIFFRPGDSGGPSVGPTGLCCPPAPPSDHWCGGLGVSLGNSEAWKPQKVGGCGWTRCPRNSVSSHIAQDTVRYWFRACLTQTPHI